MLPSVLPKLGTDSAVRRFPGVWCFLLQGIFPTQALNPGLPHCRQSPYQLSHQGSPTDCWLKFISTQFWRLEV